MADEVSGPNEAEVKRGQALHLDAMGVGFHSFLDGLGSSREVAIARTKIDEAVMWAKKHITG